MINNVPFKGHGEIGEIFCIFVHSEDPILKGASCGKTTASAQGSHSLSGHPVDAVIQAHRTSSKDQGHQ